MPALLPTASQFTSFFFFFPYKPEANDSPTSTSWGFRETHGRMQSTVISSTHGIYSTVMGLIKRICGGAFTHCIITLLVRIKLNIGSIQWGTSSSKNKPTNKNPVSVPSSFQHPGFSPQKLHGTPSSANRRKGL